MNRFWRLAALLLILPATVVSAAPKRETLISPPLPGYVVVHSASGKGRAIESQIPEGETAERWTRMVTTQRFSGVAKHISAGEYANRILAELRERCEDGAASPVEKHRIAGYKAARVKVVCTKPASGKPQSFLMLAIAGSRDMFVKEVAFPGKASAEEFLWARRYIDGVMLCNSKNKAPGCP